MSFAPIPDLLDDIRAGRMVVVLDDEDRENEGDLIMAASLVRPEDVNFMAREARGLICLALTRERCRQLALPPMVRDNRSPYGTAFTVSIEAAEGVTTGISAYDRAHTIRTAVRPDASPDDLTQPGHVFPLMAQPGGVLTRAGHTEAAVDLPLLAGIEPAGVLVEILDEDGTMARRPQLEAFAAKHGLKIGTIADLIRHRLERERTATRVHDAPVETEHGPFRLVAYRSTLDRELHYALVRGSLDGDPPPLVRVHVRNPLTDALHLKRPDFGISVHAALAQIARAGRGAVVVLSEPSTPDELLERLVSGADRAEKPAGEWRRHGLGAQILRDLGAHRIVVLGTPRRYSGLRGFGLEVVDYAPPE
ncbi:MAG TPA: 3,4-dihydroxy-2-butanone-4-phosphate synthase [Xanthomonadales bacterium]|nr:3,4-dihydroxy-2-butanone-4-phosphate synthase [Xanthomonadales bacterium]